MTKRVVLNHQLELSLPTQTDPLTLWLRLRPAPHTAAEVEAYSIQLHHDPGWLNWLRDPFENHLGRVDLPHPPKELRLDVEFIADISPVNPLDFYVDPEASQYPIDYPDQLRKELAPYLQCEEAGPKFAEWLAGVDRTKGYVVDYVGGLNRNVHESFQSDGPLTFRPVDLDQVVSEASGSSWDLSWLLTQTFRSVGLAARFTCGYFLHPAAETGQQDHARMHAWSEVFLPGAGWIGLDPAAGIFTAECHVPLASAPDPMRTAPAVGTGERPLSVSSEHLEIQSLRPVTPSGPISETQWRDIVATGCYLDQESEKRDLDLTYAAEVNFVSETNEAASQWTHLSLGDDKLQVARELLDKLKAEWAPGGVIQISQGMHYRGESSARWRLGCYFRTDGRPLCPETDSADVEAASRTAATHDDAKRFADALSDTLGLNPYFVVPAYEDRLHAWFNDPTLRADSPSAEQLRDPEQRQRLADEYSQPSADPAGYVLPIRWDPTRERWASGRWQFRRDGLFLLPGSFAIGFRLPLESLVKECTIQEESLEKVSLEDEPTLAEIYGEASARQSTVGPPGDVPDFADEETTGRAPRTALCVETRDGAVHVFLPPLQDAEHYIGLVTAIEAAASATGIRVILEGYPPPPDHRLNRMVFEPDCGLLRCHLSGTPNWQTQSELYETVYRLASEVGLRPKQRPNGHARIALGGSTAAASPFLKQPEILRSLITFWQNHPSLSYLFNTVQVGPSGHAPRCDEGRDDALYELGIALSRFPAETSSAPWVPDRLLTHLLTDASGNMQRAEIRVDQLFAPERNSRLGRIVLNSFDMASDARLASVQALLVRALVLHFAKTTYRHSLVNWQGALHDRFMLPRVLWDDLGDVIEELQATGIPLQQEWFEPFLERQFPVLGTVQIGDMTLQLRRAHEPWPLLAEELAGGSIARFVDVANERLQVEASGLVPDRYVLTCNQASVPLHPGRTQGSYVAGVRYKVHQPVSTLHPTVVPLQGMRFELIDTWSGRVIGGCTYRPAVPVSWPIASTATPTARDRRGRLRRANPPQPITNFAPSFVVGQFETHRGERGPAAMPPSREDPRSPYLLDLTKVALQ